VDDVAQLEETLSEVTGFLARYPPFSVLKPVALERLARQAEIEFFPAGAEILAQAGTPSEHLYVVRRGAVELLDEGQVIDVLEEGEAFGHRSLLSGLPPAFTVRAREDCLCYLFPSEPTLAALSDPAGLKFLAATLEGRLERATTRAHRSAPWGAARVGALATPPLTFPPETPIRHVAARMTEADTDCAAITLDDGYGILTDRDLRTRVVGGDVPVDAPASAVMRAPALAASPERLAVDVLVDMLDAGVEHVLVLDGDRLVGVVTHSALLDLEAPSPFTARQAIERATDVAGLVRAAAGLPQVAVRLLDASVEALDVVDVLATATDAVVRRLLELAIDELGEPPAPWAWLSLGSEARHEQTLATDQDNALAFDGEGPEVESYFAALAERVNTWLAQCGYAECRAGVMARNDPWRRSRAAWLELFDTWLRAPDRERIGLATIAFDFRGVAGPLPIERDLDELVRSAPRRPAFLSRLARDALAFRPPTGFLREFVVERSGDVVPIVDLARLYALRAGSTAKRTVERLRAAGARGSLAPETALALEEAFATVCQIRLEHQAAQVERGVDPDNRVSPSDLPPLARRQLKEAFRAIAKAQKPLEPHAPPRVG
jgi:CBS domain-containing protein